MAHRASRRFSVNRRGKAHSSKNGRFTRVKRNKKGQFTRKNRK
jgi:hypothetical protein